MAGHGAQHLRPTDPVGRVLFDVSRGLAIAGGIMLFGMALLTAISVTGRASVSRPIPGDFELISIGVGIAVFAFLPWCQMTGGNVIVDFFMTRAPVWAKAACDALGAALYLAIGALLTWRMVLGGVDMFQQSEKTMTINFPRWTTFPVAVLFMLLLVVVTAYTVWRNFAQLRGPAR